MPDPKTITPGQRFEAIGLLTLGWSLNSQLSSVERLLVELTGDGDCGLTSDLLYSTIRDDATRAVDDLLQSLKVTVAAKPSLDMTERERVARYICWRDSSPTATKSRSEDMEARWTKSIDKYRALADLVLATPEGWKT